MLIKTQVIHIWEWFHQQYAMIAIHQEQIPFIGEIGQAIYEDLIDHHHIELVESEINRGEHEIYGVSKEEFFRYRFRNDFHFSSEEEAVSYYFVQAEMEKILIAYPYFIEGFTADDLFISPLRAKYLNPPLQEVW